jgi:hypothetical protein
MTAPHARSTNVVPAAKLYPFAGELSVGTAGAAAAQTVGTRRRETSADIPSILDEAFARLASLQRRAR